MTLRIVGVCLVLSLLPGCAAPLLLAPAIGAGAGLGGMAVVGKYSSNQIKKQSEANMPLNTARAIGKNLIPDAVRISAIEHDKHIDRWKADTPFGSYSCTSRAGDDKAYCVKQQPTGDQPSVAKTNIRKSKAR